MDTVALGVIHPDKISAQFSKSLLALQTYKDGRIPIRLIRPSGPLVAHTRNDIADHFLHTDADWLLYIDADMVFERNTLEILMHAADPDKFPIISGLCFTDEGSPGTRPVMETWDPDLGYGHILPMSIPDNTLLQVDGVGAAFLLIHRTVLQHMKDTYHDGNPHEWGTPWFEETYQDGAVTGEDFNFCTHARQLGYPIHVHTGCRIGHEKTTVIDAETYRLQMWDYATAAASLRFVVASTGRSGTGYTAEVFNRMGIPCGHEEVFNPFYKRKRGLIGDSSWLSVPYLPQLKDRGCFVVQQVRDPLKVVNSLLGDSSLTAGVKNPYRQFKEAHCDSLTWEPGGEPLDAMRFYVEWNDRIEPFADAFWRVEDVGPSDIAKVVDVVSDAERAPGQLEGALQVPPWHRNKHNPASLGWGDLPDGGVKERLLAMARRYGYDVGD